MPHGIEIKMVLEHVDVGRASSDVENEIWIVFLAAVVNETWNDACMEEMANDTQVFIKKRRVKGEKRPFKNWSTQNNLCTQCLSRRRQFNSDSVYFGEFCLSVMQLYDSIQTMFCQR